MDFSKSSATTRTISSSSSSNIDRKNKKHSRDDNDDNDNDDNNQLKNKKKRSNHYKEKEKNDNDDNDEEEEEEDDDDYDDNNNNNNNNNQLISNNSSFMLAHETPEQVLERTDLIRKVRKENAKLFADTVQCHEAGTNAYIAAYKEFSEVALSRALETFFEGDERLLSAAIVKSRAWFRELPEQFVEVPMLYWNTTYFGNVMTTFALDMQLIANPGHLFDIVALLGAVASCAYAFNERQSPWALLAGDPNAGKSYLMKQIETILPPGVAAESMHRSALLLTAPSNADCQLLLDEEANGAMIGTDSRRQKAAASSSKSGNTLMKNYLTNKIVKCERMLGGRKRRAVTSQMGTGILATNDALPDANHPLLVRYLVLTPDTLPDEDDESIARKLYKLAACEHSAETTRAIARERLIQFYMLLVEQLIAMRALRDVDMDAFTLYWSRFGVCLSKRAGFSGLGNTKKLTSIRWLVRSLVVRKAVCTALFSEYFVRNRVDDANNYRRFLDNWRVHLRNVDRLLVAEEPEIVFGVSMCAPLFADSVEVKLMLVFRDIVLRCADTDDDIALSSVRVDSLKFLRHPDGTVSNDYVGVSLAELDGVFSGVGVPSYDLTKLVHALLARMPDGRSSFASALDTLTRLSKTDITFNKLIVQTTTSSDAAMRATLLSIPERMTGPIVRMVRFGAGVCLYVSLQALLSYKSVAGTIKHVMVNDMAHRFQLVATHVINSQFNGSRANYYHNKNNHNNDMSRRCRYNGIYDTIRTRSNDNQVHEFVNYNIVSTSQFEAITQHYRVGSQTEQQQQQQQQREFVLTTAASWFDSSIDSAAFQARQDAVAVTSNEDGKRGPSALHWHKFQTLNSTARHSHRGLFSGINWEYPSQLADERLSQRIQIDLSHHGDINTRISRLPPLSSLLMANVTHSTQQQQQQQQQQRSDTGSRLS